MLTAEDCVTYQQFVDKYQAYIYPLFGAKIARTYTRKGGRIIDMGTGPGYLSAELAQRNAAKVHAVDINPAMHELARDRISKLNLENLVQFDLADVHNLPYADEFADLVVSYSCLHHWLNPARGLAECYRVLAPGGKLIIIDTFPDQGAALEKVAQTIVEPEYLQIIEKAFSESYTDTQIADIATQAGIENYRLEPLKFAAEDILDCLDLLENLPQSPSSASDQSLCWILEAEKS